MLEQLELDSIDYTINQKRRLLLWYAVVLFLMMFFYASQLQHCNGPFSMAVQNANELCLDIKMYFSSLYNDWVELMALNMKTQL